MVVGYLLSAMVLATESACVARIADASASFLINCLSPVFYFLGIRVFNHILIHPSVFFGEFVGFQVVVD